MNDTIKNWSLISIPFCCRGLALVIVCATLGAASLSAQTRIVKTSQNSGSAAVSGATISGHVSVGVMAAERVVGSSMSGWVGFYPVKMPTQTSVEEESIASEPVHPNPASDQISVPNVGASARVNLIDGSGSSVPVTFTMRNSSALLDVAGVPNGTYSVVVFEGKSTKIYRVVILR